jgi:HAT1-interacting factor 1
MEQRLVDLRKPPVDLNAALGLPPPSQAKQPDMEMSEEVRQKATDLTGLVRKKRKAEEKPVGEADLDAKKSRTEDGEGDGDGI